MPPHVSRAWRALGLPLLCVIAWLHSVAKVALGISRVPLDVGEEALWHWKSASLVVTKRHAPVSVAGTAAT